MYTVLDLFQHKTTSGIVFDYFWIKKWDFSLGPISDIIDPPPPLTITKMMWTVFGKDSSFDFDFQTSHSIEKIVLFQSEQDRGRWLALFRSYMHFPESRRNRLNDSNHLKMGQGRGNRPRWVDWCCLFLVLKRSRVAKWRSTKFQRSAVCWNFENLDFATSIALKLKINSITRLSMADYPYLDSF